MARFCTNCGAEMTESTAFCPSCGKPAPGTTSAGPVSSQTPVASAGLSDNVAGALAYLLIPAIIFLIVEPYNRNRFVRFHSFQSIFYEVGWIIVNIGLSIILPWTLWPLHSLISLVIFVGWIVMALKAYQGQMWKLPIIGDMAEKQANS